MIRPYWGLFWGPLIWKLPDVVISLKVTEPRAGPLERGSLEAEEELEPSLTEDLHSHELLHPRPTQ